MANRLGRIYGTEEDKVNCNFYSKIGACRHGDKCSRIHNKPQISQTILFKHLYQNPSAAIAISEGNKVSDEALKQVVKHFESFYEEIYRELAEFGELEELHVCDNLGDHMIGNVYAKFNSEQDAKKAYDTLYGKYYRGKLVQEEYSPVVNFQDPRCRQYEEGNCERGGFCNFLHLKYVSRSLRNDLEDEMYYKHPEYRRRHRHRSNRYESRHHRRNSSSSSLGDFDSPERRRIIKKWNYDYQKGLLEQKRKREKEDAEIKLQMIEKKMQENVHEAEKMFNEQFSKKK